MKTRTWVWVIVGLVVVAALGFLFWVPDRESGEAPAAQTSAPPAAGDPVERGRKLVTLGNCEGCHTVTGGKPFAGGRRIPTPFGTFVTPNITPDTGSGIGSWNGDDFWHAVHNGYAPHGRLLYPTFPYTNYTKMSRADVAAMFAFLRTVPAVAAANHDHELKFPFDQRWLLAVWRGLYFTPGVYEEDPQHDAAWNRGAYLVQGVAHCSACHESRNALGAIKSKANPSGGLVLSWYAPSLVNSREAGVQSWSRDEIVTLLKSGQLLGSAGHEGTTFGPMAEVVYEGLQHADEAELGAMAVYLKSLPEISGGSAGDSGARLAHLPEIMSMGQQLYSDNCASCHGDQGEGKAAVAPKLASSRIVNLNSSVDCVRMVLYGGFAPGTDSNPRPFGMPPFYPKLDSVQIASVLTYVRASWGNRAAAVLPDQVESSKTGPLW